jgi:prephenate dehydratase
LRIIHNLIAPPGMKQAELCRVFSHPVALDQCRDFSGRIRVSGTPFYDTAGSVKHVIASKLRDAAGLPADMRLPCIGTILAVGIEDDKRNFTRFFLLRRKKRVLPRRIRRRLPSGLMNVPGALHRARAFTSAISV